MTSGGRCDFDDGGSYSGSWQDGMSHGHGICTGPLGQGEYAGSWQYGFEVSGVYTWTSGNYYEGQWLQGKRHGIGVERKGHWLYRGEWTQGFKGRYGIRQSTATGLKFEGTWTSGLQDGYGVETYADGGTYQGQWLRGLRHGYGVRQSVSYDLASRYQAVAPLPSSSVALLLSSGNEREEEAALLERDRRTEESRGGFVLLARTGPSEDATRKKQRLLLLDKHGRPSIRKTIANELRLIRQKSTGDIQEQQQLQQQQPPRSSSRQSGGSVRSTVSGMSQSSAASGRTTASSVYSDDPGSDTGSFISQTDLEMGENVVEKYLGEWKNDKRSGFGICERSDGLKYEGEWFNNKKYGYGVTTLRDGSRLEGKYKNNVLVSSSRSSKLFLLRSSKVRDRVDSAVLSAHKAAEFALQKAEIANARMTSARMKCEQAEEAAKMAVADADMARAKAREYSPNSNRQTPGEKIIANRLQEEDLSAEFAEYDPNLSDRQTMGPVAAPQPSPKKFSFFRFKKDASLLRGARNGPPSSLAQTQTAQLHPGPAAVCSPLPSFQITSHHQPSTQMANDFLRPAQQLGAPVGGTAWQHQQQQQQAPSFAAPSSPPRGQFSTSVDHRWTAGHAENAVSFRQQQHHGHGGPVTPQSPTMNAFPPGAVNIHNTMHAQDQPSSSSPPVSGHLGPGFEDSYNWMGYGGERRKSLPSIVKDKNPSTGSTAAAAAANHPQTPATASSSLLPPSRPQVDTYVIEDGVRKKVRPLYPDLPGVQKSQSLLERERLPKKLYELEAPSLYRRGDKGSMPDVTAIKDADVMPREAVYVMSQHRREELMRERAEEERRRRNQIVFRLGDLKDWCQRRQVLVFVLALNVGLAAVFYNMLQ